MPKFVVVTCRIPTNYNAEFSYVVEAECGEDAAEVMRHQLRDFGSMRNYVYTVKPYTPPPAGHVVGRV